MKITILAFGLFLTVLTAKADDLPIRSYHCTALNHKDKTTIEIATSAQTATIKKPQTPDYVIEGIYSPMHVGWDWIFTFWNQISSNSPCVDVRTSGDDSDFNTAEAKIGKNIGSCGTAVPYTFNCTLKAP